MKCFLSIMMVVLFGIVGSAQDALFTYGTDYGFTEKFIVTNSYTWTNNNAYPFKIASLQFNSGTNNTSMVVRLRPNIICLYAGNTITTNPMGWVETNIFYVPTNTITAYITNSLLTVTNTGAQFRIYDTEDIPQQYILLGDVLKFDFSDNCAKIIYMDAIR